MKYGTRSTAVAERPRDASCLSVAGFNITIPAAIELFNCFGRHADKNKCLKNCGLDTS